MIAITGASGKTGFYAAELLLKNGHQVRAIGRSAEHLRPLTHKGAESFIGDQSDAQFLTRAFTGAHSAYVLIPPKMDAEDVRGYYDAMGAAVVGAIRKSGLRKVVFLSSLGADRSSGTGPVVGLHDVERLLGGIKEVDIVFLRAGYFYENTLMNIGLIKSKKINGGPTKADAPILMVAAKDISAKVAELLANPVFTGHSIEELFGQRITYREVTESIGNKIGIPDLPYVQIPDKDAIEAMTGMGLSKRMAESFVELAHGLNEGHIGLTELSPEKPNAPTSFNQFVEEVFGPAYEKAFR
jgi:uncharacterized protein YbjT (DUF2867 family)